MTLFETMFVLGDVREERQRQDAKWGEQNHPDGTGTDGLKRAAERARIQCNVKHAEGRGTWLDILLEEVAEAGAADTPEKLVEELVQVAAVAVAWIEAIKRRQT